MTFRDALKDQMKEKNLTVRDIAEIIDCTESYIYALLQGQRRFNEEIEDRICDSLGITRLYIESSAIKNPEFRT